MPKVASRINVDLASLLGTLFFTWVILQLFPVSEWTVLPYFFLLKMYFIAIVWMDHYCWFTVIFYLPEEYSKSFIKNWKDSNSIVGLLTFLFLILAVSLDKTWKGTYQVWIVPWQDVNLTISWSCSSLGHLFWVIRGNLSLDALFTQVPCSKDCIESKFNMELLLWKDFLTSLSCPLMLILTNF